jgi:hypothetical protein
MHIEPGPKPTTSPRFPPHNLQQLEYITIQPTTLLWKTEISTT